MFAGAMQPLCFSIALQLSPGHFLINRTVDRKDGRRSVFPRPYPSRVVMINPNVHPNQSPDTKASVVVVGAGVIGLTTAIRLREAGHAVSIIAEETPSSMLDRNKTRNKDFPRGTYSSSGAGGLWKPFKLAGDDIKKWGTTTYKTLENQVEKNVGVKMLEGFILRATSKPELPWFATLTKMDIVTPAEDKRIPSRYHSALRFTAPVVQMDLYLPYLEQWARRIDVNIEFTRDHAESNGNSKWDLSQVMEFAKKVMGNNTVIVNCTGVDAKLISGEEMIPGRGVTLMVKRPVHFDYFIAEDESDAFESGNGLLTYAIPRGDFYTLGGTFFPGDWNQEASQDEIVSVKKRCNALLDGIEQAEEVNRWSGLRPIRAAGTARVEVDENLKHCDLRVIANYGHGGSGITICWGCADHVVDLVNK